MENPRRVYPFTFGVTQVFRWSLCWMWLFPFSSAATLPATRIAIIGDYGVDGPPEAAVANLIKTNFRPQSVVTLGDNNYGTASDFDRVVGQYYHEFIGNYGGTYGMGASSNRFWPALGNHDYLGGSYNAYTSFFTLPGNERYYDVIVGPVHFFITNSDEHEPHGTGSSSVQALWLSNRLAASTSPWKAVVVHHPPYSSGGSFAYTRWPFAQWGASVVLAGHAHLYERLLIDGLPYFVNGLGGADIHGVNAPIAGSVIRYNARHGAMLLLAESHTLTFEFHSVANGGTLIDRFTMTKTNRPPVIQPIPDQDVAVGHAWTWTPAVQDDDIPRQTLRFWLGNSAPTGLTVNATNGTLAWTPTSQQVPRTNMVTLMVADNAPLPATNSVAWKLYAVSKAAPTLLIGRSQTDSPEVACAWPTSYAEGFTLQMNDRPRSNAWTSWTGTITRTNGQSLARVPGTNAARYFRLRK